MAALRQGRGTTPSTYSEENKIKPAEQAAKERIWLPKEKMKERVWS
jgi:hypothetical protein